MSERAWDLGALGAGLAVLLAHGAWVLRDGRAVWDPGQFYSQVPTALEGLRRLDPGLLWQALTASGGPYQVFLGTLMALTGLRDGLMEGAFLGWTALALVATWTLARTLGNARAGLAAVSLVGTMPLITHWGRIGWIHIPEAALLTAAAVLLARDLSLSRRGTAWGLALLGAAALSLRPSAMVFAAPLALLVLLAGRRSAPWRVAGIGAAWVLGALPGLLGLVSYLRIKVDARPRYAVSLPTAWEEAPDVLGPALVLGLVGLGLLLWRRRHRLHPVAWVLLGWMALAVGLDLGFRVGLFNFTLLGVGLAVLGGMGLGEARARLPALLAPAVLGLVLLLPEVPGSTALARVPTLEAHLAPADPWHQHRPWTGYGLREVEQLFDALCRGPRCQVAVDQGLFFPFSEDPGAFTLFAIDRLEVGMVDVRAWEQRRGPRVAALVSYDCPDQERDRLWRRRNPGTAQGLVKLIDSQDLVPVWGRELVEGCSVWWWTPGGRLSPDAVLPQGLRPDRAEAEARRERTTQRYRHLMEQRQRPR